MNKDILRNNKSNHPIENHETAAWSDIKHVKQVSNVPIPFIEGVSDAKEWVDENQK